MARNVETVKKLYSACMSKDFETVRNLLHPEYTLKDSMMEINSADEFIEMMKSCPFECRIENVNFVSEGDKVVGTFDSVATAPVAYTMRMCSVIRMEDGKVRAEEMFYDTARIPREAMEEMKRSAPDKRAAA